MAKERNVKPCRNPETLPAVGSGHVGDDWTLKTQASPFKEAIRVIYRFVQACNELSRTGKEG